MSAADRDGCQKEADCLNCLHPTTWQPAFTEPCRDHQKAVPYTSDRVWMPQGCRLVRRALWKCPVDPHCPGASIALCQSLNSA